MQLGVNPCTLLVPLPCSEISLTVTRRSVNNISSTLVTVVSKTRGQPHRAHMYGLLPSQAVATGAHLRPLFMDKPRIKGLVTKLFAWDHIYSPYHSGIHLLLQVILSSN